MQELLIKIITPNSKPQEFVCDSINLQICDDAFGKGGGSYGIRKGHAKAILALDSGAIIAQREGATVCNIKTSGGFAVIENNTVTVTVDKAE